MGDGMTRQRLPNRRPCVTFDQKINNIDCTISYGYAPEGGGVKELFINAGKSGEAIEGIMRDAATGISIALQCGATPAELAHSITRNPDDKAASPIGVVLDDMVME